MAITYSWIITSLECLPEQDGKEKVVNAINWRRKAVDENDLVGEIFGRQSISLDLSAPFTSYDDLTEPQTIDWLLASFTPAVLTSQEEDLVAQIAAQINPPMVSPPLPWA